VRVFPWDPKSRSTFRWALEADRGDIISWAAFLAHVVGIVIFFYIQIKPKRKRPLLACFAHVMLVLSRVISKQQLEDEVLKKEGVMSWVVRGLMVLGVTRKIRMTALTQLRVLNTFKYNTRAQRDCDSLCK
jgi:predicted histidine transporter YuiF (NhaC family)